MQHFDLMLLNDYKYWNLHHVCALNGSQHVTGLVASTCSFFGTWSVLDGPSGATKTLIFSCFMMVRCTVILLGMAQSDPTPPQTLIMSLFRMNQIYTALKFINDTHSTTNSNANVSSVVHFSACLNDAVWNLSV